LNDSVLLVEDDLDVRGLLCEYLPRYGIAVTAVSSCAAARDALQNGAFDLITLDLHLPDADGLTLARELRERANAVPIIIVSARREEADRVLGLELGADDYLTKPFSPRELLARIRAVLRRTKHRAASQGTAEVDAEEAATADEGTAAAARAAVRMYRFAGWELNVKSRRFTSPQAQLIPLTIGEFNLLMAFLERPQQVLSREQLLQGSRLYEDVYDRTIDVQILRLRRKIERDARAPEFIRTERGIGYVFTATVERVMQ
jgi:DNA-binding response OmpR family regulator